MTDRVYFRSDSLEMNTSVVSCRAHENGLYRIVLLATLFHPQGGGQPSDKGMINDVNVVQVFLDQGEVVHLTDGPVEIGVVILKVDAAWRKLHTRYHSAGHLITAVSERYGWVGLKGNHWPGESRVTLNPSNNPISLTEQMLAIAVAELVTQNLPRVIAEKDGKRTVRWGPLAESACGGTHVQTTGEIGAVQIIRARLKKGQLSVQYELSTQE
ncbi:putative metal-dependent hydrolase related to alanyl-tRNA synthetase HxxxH domain [Pseudomonas sp. GM49]|nr:putative metal-dependent hydrolase related to alanyl-tRNA synthetase HxxxH domain [Pseudomonas sp. GM49]